MIDGLTIEQINNLSHSEWVKFKKKNQHKLYNKYPNYNFEARYGIMLEIKKIIESEGIDLLLTNGTLLGAVREKDFIEWDKDVDMDILARDFVPNFESIKRKIMLSNPDYIVRGISHHPWMKINTLYKGEKVGVLAIYKNEKFYYRGPYQWTHGIYDTLEEINFKGETFKTPKIQDYLVHQYGENWKEPLKENYFSKELFGERNENRRISDAPIDVWKKVRNTYYTPNQGMPTEHAKDVLFEVDELLKIYGIDYFLSCGTALGLYRDGNFIPWDDEIDIEIFSEHFVLALDDLRELFIENGFIARATPRGNTSKMGLFKKGVKIAIGSIYRDNNGYRCDLYQKFPESFFDNPQIYNFCGRDFRLPGPTDEYLTFYYGDWKTVIKSYDINEYLNKDKRWKK